MDGNEVSFIKLSIVHGARRSYWLNGGGLVLFTALAAMLPGACTGEPFCGETRTCPPAGGGGEAGAGGAGEGGAAGSSGVSGGDGMAGSSGSPAECETSETRCNEQGQRETCSVDGEWGAAVDCPFVCVGDDCDGECVPEEQGCLLGKVPRACDNEGNWVEGDECPAVCLDGACQASCDTGSKQCSGKDVLVCTAQGNFEVEQTCPFFCDTETKECVGVCEPTTQRCDGPRLQTCGVDAMWQTIATCPALCTPKTGVSGQFECSGDCAPDSRQCANASTLQVCNESGEYEDTDCAASNKTCFSVAGLPGCNGSCAPGQQRCQSNRVQNCNAAGNYVDAPGNCTTSNQTCVQSASSASCQGECSAGQVSCLNNDANTCSITGTWMRSDDCAPPEETCDAGACVANDPYTVGEDSASGWDNYNPPNDLWHVVRVVPPKTADVIAIRIIGRAAGGTARMALWQDSGGAPGEFVAQTDNINLSVGVGSDAPIPLASKVTGGQPYWVGAKFTNNAAIHQDSRAGLTGYSFSQTFAANPSATMDPFPTGSAGTFTGVALNFFLLVRDESL